MSTSKLLIRFAKPYPVLTFLTILLGFSGALFNGVSTALIVPVILRIVGQEVDFSGAPAILKKLMSPFDNIPENYLLGVMAGTIIFTILLKNIATYASTLASSTLTRKVTSDMRETGLILLLQIDLSYYAKTKVGDIINSLGGEISRAASAVGNTIKLIILGITILVFVGILLSISWQLTIAATVLLSLVTLINQYAISRAKQFGKQLSDMSRAYSIAILETLNGIRLVKATGSEQREYQRIRKLIHAREKADFKSQVYSEAIAPLSEVMGVTAIILIVFLSRTFFVNQIVSLSTVLLTYLLVLLRLLPFISQLNTLRSSFASTTTSVDVVTEFLSWENKPLMSNGSIVYTKLNKGVGFQSVCFSYPDHEKQVLKDVNLYLAQGTTLALVGGSGAGKSTLADLLPRFYDPTSGCITIDDIDLCDFDLLSIRQVMGIVSQDTFLFNDSVWNNIAYGRQEATKEEIITAAKQANAYEFISELPQGFKTIIGDRGVMLSGGQRQRLAIARALLQDPQILILDEATSALDTVSERLVQEAIDNLSRDRTTLVIAHRLSTVQKADQIAVLDQGSVVEVGTHEELLQKGGYYSRLYAMQFADKVETATKRQQNLVRVSHEIRTRLQSMIGSLRLLVDDRQNNLQQPNKFIEESYKSGLKVLNSIDVFEDIVHLQTNWTLSGAQPNHNVATLNQNLIVICNQFRMTLDPILSSLNSLANDSRNTLPSQQKFIQEAYQALTHLLEKLDHFDDNLKV
ncbi:MAG: ATP-binding cassette domain-containing protein [Brasilonema octagenarum HA4186-MV1]|jgi:subfamily B ATP-binding cassette protein MsbA|uniref:ABC transporter ATP-binding protein n=1 Tax=Brasilonema octagenarum UFV-OR1 TaxID=417115 RepID=A0ABX1MCA2_9CYAN|nr:ABC transporter ATP-binding protein [Brasilonema octagenarum]MBW4626174.1 ATP-binding cassette domain-containing protein [Brasilonema octagenarum HA4186-MV1]NMF66244.1 ABC transporter ATP-binding protein [Brasilonema octagenarum UFV-OR1]